MFTSQRVNRVAGQELRSAELYGGYRKWCNENGFKYENAANFRRKMETAGFVYMRRRPWNEKDRQLTTMVNNVVWSKEEESLSEFCLVSDDFQVQK